MLLVARSSRIAALCAAPALPASWRFFSTAGDTQGMSMPQLVKELRSRTGSPMMECKKALEQSGGDLDAAIDELRKRGVAMAGKKSVRTTSEGVVGLRILENGRCAVLCEVNSETDFVAKNPDFVSFAEQVTDTVASSLCSAEELEDEILVGSTKQSVSVARTDLVARLGENIHVRRTAVVRAEPRWENSSVVVAPYVHAVVGDQLGRSGCVVVMECQAPGKEEALLDVGTKLAMQITAMRPAFVDRASVPEQVLEKEREILMEQARSSGKPDHILQKVIEGRLNVFFKEECLLEQEFVVSETKGETVAKHLKQLSGKLGGEVVVHRFLKFERGEGIAQKKNDFAEEVASQAAS